MSSKVDPTRGRAALTAWAAGADVPASEQIWAVRYSLECLTKLHPGRALEVRVPPAGATQILGGTTHRRGTPPAVVEMNMATWLDLCVGRTDWESASERVDASGQRANLAPYLPLTGYF
ncbi:sterol carrier family protein [Scrofimicrobium sp. R131]|uniref:Sterol carrier family protein n=1 Tax=Scrofimicrobium appendicitidis TaxID=3079930 RepID=A0AAU7V809_9ACTO